MRFRVNIIALITTCLTFYASGAARAGPVTVFTDLDAFLEAAGDVQEIDFETLPDGSPSYFGVEITPKFNYTNQGAEFFSHVPDLFIAGNPIGGFELRAGPLDTSTGPLNWLIAELVQPATAVGIVFPGSTTLSFFDTQNELITSQVGGGPGPTAFLGITSETNPIATITVNRGDDIESINSFFFAPIPEPATGLILGVGMLGLLLRRNRAKGGIRHVFR